MKEGQKSIYYVCGQTMEEVLKSPFLEKLIEQGSEVVLFTEAMDEYMMQACPMHWTTFQNDIEFCVELSHPENIVLPNREQ